MEDGSLAHEVGIGIFLVQKRNPRYLTRNAIKRSLLQLYSDRENHDGCSEPKYESDEAASIVGDR